MALQLGHKLYIGFGDESTYGSAVTPTKFVEILEENLHIDDSYVPKPSTRGVTHSKKCQGKNLVSGDIRLQVGYSGYEKLFKHALGSSSVSGSGTYTHVFTLTDQPPTGLTFECPRQDTYVGGVDYEQYTYAGCQIQKLSLSQEVENFLEASFSIVGQDEIYGSDTATSFPTFVGVEWRHCTVSINAVSTYKVKSWSVELDNNIAQDRHKLGDALIAGAGRGGKRSVKWKMSLEFDSQTVKNLYKNKTMVPLLVQYSDGTRSFEVLSPNCALTKAEDSVSESGPLGLDIEAEAYYSSALNDELQITIINATAGPD